MFLETLKQMEEKQELGDFDNNKNLLELYNETFRQVEEFCKSL